MSVCVLLLDPFESMPWTKENREHSMCVGTGLVCCVHAVGRAHGSCARRRHTTRPMLGSTPGRVLAVGLLVHVKDGRVVNVCVSLQCSR